MKSWFSLNVFVLSLYGTKAYHYWNYIKGIHYWSHIKGIGHLEDKEDKVNSYQGYSLLKSYQGYWAFRRQGRQGFHSRDFKNLGAIKSRCSYYGIARCGREEHTFSTFYFVLVCISTFVTCTNGLFTQHHVGKDEEVLWKEMQYLEATYVGHIWV